MSKWIFGATLFVAGMISGGLLLAGINSARAQAEDSEVLVNMQQMINSQEASGDNLSYINGEIPRDNSEVRQSFDKVMDSYLVMWNELPNLYQLIEDLEKQKTQVDPGAGLPFSGVIGDYGFSDARWQQIQAGVAGDVQLYIRSSSSGVSRATVTCLGGMEHWATEQAEGCIKDFEGYDELRIDTITDVDVDTHEPVTVGWQITSMYGGDPTVVATLNVPLELMNDGGFRGTSTNIVQGKVLR